MIENNTKLNGSFFQTWREKYRWLHTTRKASEEKIKSLENLVINNILQDGPKKSKDILLEIVYWKTRGRSVWRLKKY